MAEMVMTAEKLNRKNSAKRFYRYKEAAHDPKTCQRRGRGLQIRKGLSGRCKEG